MLQYKGSSESDSAFIYIYDNSILLESAKGHNSSTQEAYIRDTQLW